MNNQKCPVCKECLDLEFYEGARYYICYRCYAHYELTLNGISKVNWAEIQKNRIVNQILKEEREKKNGSHTDDE